MKQLIIEYMIVILRSIRIERTKLI